jgi:hypothetical protein
MSRRRLLLQLTNALVSDTEVRVNLSALKDRASFPPAGPVSSPGCGSEILDHFPARRSDSSTETC